MRSAALCIRAIVFAIPFTIRAAPSGANTLKTSGSLPGATVEMDGLVVGKTLYETEMPGGYFHKTQYFSGSPVKTTGTQTM